MADSDSGVVDDKKKGRGRPRVEKRTAPESKDGTSPIKRGRGRPKGSKGQNKKSPKKTVSSGKGRGRPKKSEKKESSAEETE